MKLGAFSISLTVNDLEKSISFYTKLGFVKFKGSVEHKWVIMKNDNSVIGLFEKMFDTNILTFNPGWNQDGNEVEDFDDIRALKKNCEESGIEVFTDNVEKAGPCSFMLRDPDGNLILIDQHI
ncbi:MAG: VOC family protein [Pleomorphochaeta sp.]